MASSINPSFPFIYLCSLCFFITTEASQIFPQEQQYDRVLNLPGQPTNASFSHFSGYITVNQDHGRALFYWFFEAQTHSSEKPLLLWLNGGPGCSSIGYGAAVELGPFKVKTNGTGLDFNEHAWNKEANLLFLESPVGVGFSYTNTSSDLGKLDDEFVAEDAYNFLVNWFKKFPQYQAHDFYISGESYAGHYVPQLAEVVYDRNKDSENYPFINLKGFIVGNPETDDFYDTKGLVEFAWSHAVVSDEVYKRINQLCDFKVSNWTQECIDSVNVIYQQYREIDIYNIYAPVCLVNSASSLASSHISNFNAKVQNRGIRRMRIHGGYDPCFSTYAEEYFNRVDVQTSLHANITGKVNGKWKICNDSILGTYNFTVFSVLPIYTKLVKAGLKIWVYSGDVDGRVPAIGSRYCMEALGLPLKSPWHSWYQNNQVGGRFVNYQGLTLVTVRGAGHLVPLNKPSEALLLVNSFLLGHDLPTQR